MEYIKGCVMETDLLEWEEGTAFEKIFLYNINIFCTLNNYSIHELMNLNETKCLKIREISIYLIKNSIVLRAFFKIKCLIY